MSRRAPLRHAILVALAAALGACKPGASETKPEVLAPALALLHADPVDNPSGDVHVSLQGTGLGAAAAGSFDLADCGTRAGGAFVALRDAAGLELARIPSTDAARAASWTDARILLRSPDAAAAASALVCTPSLRATVAVERWAYDHFDVPASQGTLGAPLAVAADAAGRVWVDEEFHTQVKALDAAGRWTQLDLPQAPGAGIFAQTVFGDTPSRIATLGEAIALEPSGRVWMTESGPSPYFGPNANHARIVAFDPAASRLDVYNVPGDDSGVVGIAWDEARQRVWFTQARRSTGGAAPAVALEARLTSFDPRRVAPDGAFPFAPSEACTRPAGAAVGSCSVTTHRRCLRDTDCVLADRVCAPGADEGACFHEHELPADAGVELPSHVLVHSDGSIWYSAYWGGNHVGRLDPATGQVIRFPLPQPAGRAACDYGSCACFSGPPAAACPAHCCRYLLLGSGPWSLVEDGDGSVLFCGQGSLTVGRLDAARIASAACRALDASGENPCLRQWAVPGASPATDLIHSIARGVDGRVWVTWSPDVGFQGDPRHPASVGFLDPVAGRVLVLPPLSAFGFVDASGAPVAFGGAGVAVDSGGAVWFADYFRRRLGRVRRLP